LRKSSSSHGGFFWFVGEFGDGLFFKKSEFVSNGELFFFLKVINSF
jgi:hypothetical protein